jgi:SAM-dependent methyltransferase
VPRDEEYFVTVPQRPAATLAPGVLARPGTHETVFAILAPLPRGRLLDVPAGEGALAARFLSAGFDVHCCDLYPEIFRLKGVEIRRGDLSASLPYGDAEFDYVTCVEGLEHIENPQQAIREFARVLKPGGHLVVSTPNMLNIEERIKLLLFGYTSHFKPLSREHVAATRERAGGRDEVLLHMNPISYSELRFSLEKSGFEVQGAYRDRRKPRLWLYAPITLLIKLLALTVPEAKKRERWTRELNSNAVLTGGNTLIFHAIKRTS